MTPDLTPDITPDTTPDITPYRHRVSSTRIRRSEPARRPLALAVSAACLLMAGWSATAPAPARAQALPSGLQVVRGSATTSTQGSALTVTNSANAILNWQAFSIGSGASVHFQQPGASSQVLNRVVGNDPSALLGSLTSNGRVWLLNPNGVIFGRDARVDVAGLVAGTLRTSDSDWLAGLYRLGTGGTAGTGAGVTNLGDIRTQAGGRVLLVSDGAVRNEGSISAPGGQVALVSARQVTLVDSARPNIAVSAPAGEVVNSGMLQAAGGRVDLQGAMVNQQGLVSADAIGNGPGGQVLLQASGDTLVSGTVSARSDGGAGGDVRLLGRHVGLVGSARVDASGAAGGGQVLVGGGLQGRDASVPNAAATYIGPDTTIAADATQAGEGGRIIVWSDDATRAYGTLLARGGPQGGNGGFIETSGGWLDAAPRLVSTAATAGRAGQWLLDPHDLLISDSVADTNIGAGPSFSTTGDSAQLSTATILAALNAGNNVSITTASVPSTTQAGDVQISNATLQPTNSAPVTLTVNAAGQLVVSNSTFGSATAAAPFNLSLNAGTALQVSGSTVTSSGGAVNLRANGGNVDVSGSTLRTGGGILSVFAASSFTLQGGTADSGAGLMDLSVNGLQLSSNGVLTSTATNDAIVMHGSSGPFLSTFQVDPGSDIVTPNGRWLLFTDSASGFTPNALAYTFKQYGGTTALDAVNSGVIFNVSAPSLAVTTTSTPTKVYDGSTAISLAGSGMAVVGGVLPGDTVSVSPVAANLTGDFSGKDAGFGIPIAVNPAALVASDGAGHTVLGYVVSDLTGDITRRPLTPTVNVASKTYDGSIAASASVAGVSGLVGNETLNIVVAPSGTPPTFADPNVGTAKPVSVDLAAFNGSNGGLASNYQLPATVVATADITPAPLSITVFSPPLNKTYDGTTTAVLPSGAVLSGLVGNETLGFTPSANFSDPNAGVGKTVTVSGAITNGANGGLASNYALPTPAVATATITPKALTLGAVTANDKVYDGSLTTTGTAALAGLVGSETLAVNAVGSFLDPNAGTAKPVTVNVGLGDGANGGLAANYTLAVATASASASILQRPLSLTPTVAGKVYDGTTSATITGTTLGNLIGTETLVVNASGSFSDPNAGVAKPVSVTATLADGSNGGLAANYTLAVPVITSATISPRPLTLSGTAADKVYDGGTAATVTPTGLLGLVGTQTLVVNAFGNFSDPNVGTAKPVALGASLADGANGGLAANYVVTGGSATASITPATLTYVATPAQTFFGTPLPPLGGSVQGLVSGDTLAGATSGQLTFTTPAAMGSPPGTYAVQGGGLAAANYVFVQDPANSQALQVLDAAPLAAANQSRTALDSATQRTAPAVTAQPAPPGVNAIPPVLDLTPATRPAPGGSLSFQPLPLAQMDPGEVSRVLQARDHYKRDLFAGALGRLALEPDLPDLPVCETVEQLQGGKCLITESLKQQAQAQRGEAVSTAVAAPPAATGTAAPATPPAPGAPVAPPATAATAAASPAAAPPAGAPATAAAPAAAAVAAAPRPQLQAPRTVRSASLPQIRRKLALVVGTNRYADTRIPQLETAVSDARAVAATLENSLGYETTVLADGGKADLVAALNRLAVEARPQDSIVVYYAGHGELSPDTGLGYWQLSDARADDPRGWVSNRDIGKLLGLFGAQQVALISDSCYSGSLVGGERIQASGAPSDVNLLLSRKAAVAMSSGGNEPVSDEGRDGHSPFAFNLLQQLQALPAWQPGSSVFERLRFAVAREVPQRPRYGAAPQAGHQSGADYLFERRQLDAAPK